MWYSKYWFCSWSYYRDSGSGQGHIIAIKSAHFGIIANVGYVHIIAIQGHIIAIKSAHFGIIANVGFMFI